VNASLLLLKSTLPDWRQKKSGRVINIGSEVVNIGNPEFAHYVAAEAAMLGLTRSWARELGPDGITVNLVEPGWIPVERHAGETASSIDAYRREVPMGRMGLPSDLVGMVVFLTSPRASFVTGQSFAVNGGRTLCQSDSLIM
jgi:3-oxoacyl-[acyl-carrier protein] reductase